MEGNMLNKLIDLEFKTKAIEMLRSDELNIEQDIDNAFYLTNNPNIEYLYKNHCKDDGIAFFEKVTDKLKKVDMGGFDLQTIHNHYSFIREILMDKRTYGLLFISHKNKHNLSNPFKAYRLMNNSILNDAGDLYIYRYPDDMEVIIDDELVKKYLIIIKKLIDCCEIQDDSNGNKQNRLYRLKGSAIYNYFRMQHNTLLCYHEMLNRTTVAPFYAVSQITVGANTSTAKYYKDIPCISSNVSVAGNVCCGSFANYTPEGIKTLKYSNMSSAFTNNIISLPNYYSWVHANKIAAWLEYTNGWGSNNGSK